MSKATDASCALFGLATVLQLMTSSVLAAPGRYSLIGDAGWQPLTSEHSPWMAESSNGSVQVPAVIPGQIHLDFERAGVIGDTYFRLNAVQDNTWVRQESWSICFQRLPMTERFKNMCPR